MILSMKQRHFKMGFIIHSLGLNSLSIACVFAHLTSYSTLINTSKIRLKNLCLFFLTFHLDFREYIHTSIYNICELKASFIWVFLCFAKININICLAFSFYGKETQRMYVYCWNGQLIISLITDFSFLCRLVI